jgi:hypothetical protein
MMHADEPTPARKAFSVPASLLSLAVHVVLLVTIALCVPAAVRSLEEPGDRSVGIVLASRTPESTEYFQDPADQTTDGAATADAAATAKPEGPKDLALPSAEAVESLSLPEIPLPQLPGGLPRDSLLVPDLSLSGGGGRRPILPGQDDAEILAAEAARRAGRQSLGPTTELSVFGSAPARGRSFVFAIDRSKSMGGEGLNAFAAARDELGRAVAGLSPSHRFQIIAYSHTVVYYTETPRLIAATEDAKAGIPAFFDRLGAVGGTDHEMAVRAALGMEPDVVFLLTDGGDPYLNAIQLTNLRKLAEGIATIHCIQFGFGPLADDDSYMAKLARQNGGGFTYVDMGRR